MVSHEYTDAIDIVGQTLRGGRCSDDHAVAAAMTLAERLERLQQLGGAFEKISFSPQMDTLLNRQWAAAV